MTGVLALLALLTAAGAGAAYSNPKIPTVAAVWLTIAALALMLAAAAVNKG
jgi:hypothetical protein